MNEPCIWVYNYRKIQVIDQGTNCWYRTGTVSILRATLFTWILLELSCNLEIFVIHLN